MILFRSIRLWLLERSCTRQLKRLEKRKRTEYRTPSGRLAPYPNMSDDELDDYERWADGLAH